LTPLDWLIVLIVVASAAMAAGQGFFLELFSLGGAVLGYLLAAWNHQRLVPLFDPYVKSTAVSAMAAFLLIFLVVLFAGGLAGRITSWAVKESGLRWYDRLLGGAFGLLRGVIVASAIVMALVAFLPETRVVGGSVLGRYLLVTGRMVAQLAPEDIRDRFRSGMEAMSKRSREKQEGAAGGHRTSDDAVEAPKEKK